MEDRPQKAHRPSQSGNKAERKASKKGKSKEQNGGFNEKVILVLRLAESKAEATLGIHHEIWSPSGATGT
jgi:hypothetical protein